MFATDDEQIKLLRKYSIVKAHEKNLETLTKVENFQLIMKNRCAEAAKQNKKPEIKHTKHKNQTIKSTNDA